MPTLEEIALENLRRAIAPDAMFRAGQLDAIIAIVRDRSRALVVQRTGWGKSVVYFIATRLLRDEDAGPTLLVSPLLALMRNQIAMATKLGLDARTINSSNQDEWEAVAAALGRDQVDLLLVSPERFSNPYFRDNILPLVAEKAGLLVIDEAHCISDWGHDFRPDYRRLIRVLGLLPRGVPVLCTTATANDRVVADIGEQLGEDIRVFRGSLDRKSLSLCVVDLPSPAQRLAWLAQHVPSLTGSGIIYTLTVPDTDRVAGWLHSHGIDAVAYSGDSDADVRMQIEDDLIANRVKVVVATSALGMGFDKPDLGFVIHYQSPGSPIAYYQQVGRAGRALDHAPAILLRGYEDQDIQDYFINTAFPPKHQADEVVEFLQDRATPVGPREIEAAVNVRPSRLQGMLKILEVEGAVQRADSQWQRTLKPWAYPTERVDRVTEARRAEQQAMKEYAASATCLMEFLQRQLDDPQPELCGHCMTCTARRPSTEVDEQLRREAIAYLRADSRVIEPRRQWPPGLDSPRGQIPPELRLEEGRALCVYNDGGWGGLVRRGKFDDGAFSDELVTAATELIRSRWCPDPFPTWVTCVPSTSRPELVVGFAEKLATALELPFVPFLTKAHQTRPQKEMENSAQQLGNVLGAFDVADQPAQFGPVLLVDDIVDSRWTLTVAGFRLREAGSGPVYPFALATAVSG